MSGDDDNERTVFGQKLPTPPPRAQQPAPPPPQPQQPAPPPSQGQRPVQPEAERTVFGAPIPQAPQPHRPAQPQYPQQQPYPQAPQPTPGRSAPVSNQPPAGYEDTWLGGALNPYPDQAPQQPHYQPQPPQTPLPYQQPAYQQPPAYGQRPQYQPQSVPTGAEMFPEIQREQQVQRERIVPRISLDDALKGTGLGAGGSTNPLVAAAANLLILLGRLRTGLVEMQAIPLMEHVAREIDLFERNAYAGGVSQQDVMDGKYALAATADDIVQNLPGADRSTWLQYSMIARFFGERDSGVGFFRKMDAAMQAPGQRFHVLELMGTCLSLGFEGQYRTSQNGSIELARIRSAIYETLRRVRPRPDDDISVNWAAVPLGVRKRFGGTPVWAVAAIAAAMVVATFATLSTLISRQGAEVQTKVLALHQNLPPLTIERTAPVVEAFVAPTSNQLDRIREALADQIEGGLVVVDQAGQFIFVRVGEALRFRSGQAELESDFAELAGHIARALDSEPGPIRVVGYTDNVPLSGRGRYKTNEELSLARAETVGGIIGPMLTDATRISTEGLGPIDPIADNETPEGRALNRRVEVMIAREGNE